jgi:glycopeptide antibiotics resistance protein
MTIMKMMRKMRKNRKLFMTNEYIMTFIFIKYINFVIKGLLFKKIFE